MQPKKRIFKNFSFEGIEIDALLDMTADKLVKLFHACTQCRSQRLLKKRPMALIKKLLNGKREAPAGEKPEPVCTHLSSIITLPEMIGNNKYYWHLQWETFNQVQIKLGVIGYYLGKFSISYTPVKHGRPDIGATHPSHFVPVK
ncbi:hypothetical protein KP509_04G102500 [Ceratopteris richardii]|uniref:40S ribosomal protein S15 n=1 Tax=Ceratopteris richardii TaxID=49495 RepID=A0A8T2V3E3_CERRI|nr:hypothetical protein KP509_04G102500 [Ceratopteris richardii]